MIKVNVEWRHTCSSCGTQLVVDYLRDRQAGHLCPWCGSPKQSSDGDEQIRKVITDAVARLENKVNSRAAATS
jgi:predicted RNA-binding Zn-ribbon protein involved in translation (DUF1610 family)